MPCAAARRVAGSRALGHRRSGCRNRPHGESGRSCPHNRQAPRRLGPAPAPEARRPRGTLGSNRGATEHPPVTGTRIRPYGQHRTSARTDTADDLPHQLNPGTPGRRAVPRSHTQNGGSPGETSVSPAETAVVGRVRLAVVQGSSGPVSRKGILRVVRVIATVAKVIEAPTSSTSITMRERFSPSGVSHRSVADATGLPSHRMAMGKLDVPAVHHPPGREHSAATSPPSSLPAPSPQSHRKTNRAEPTHRTHPFTKSLFCAC